MKNKKTKTCLRCGTQFPIRPSRKNIAKFCSLKCKYGDIKVRLWGKIKKTKNCWNWQCSGDGKGYGKISVAGKMRRVHRIIYELAFGKVPSRMCVLHKCDNRGCVNPAHLFIGTQLDNIRDMVKKGRARNRYTKT